jgi:CheY-like chemotaxis protein
VLIVDDSEDGAESLAMLLEFGGHETHKAHDGIAALEAAERLRPDAVLLDIGLPGLNGYEVCRRIRQTPWGEPITLVALTGWGQDEDRDRSREAGFDAHMVKPVDFDALLKLLASVSPVDAEPKSAGG